MFAYLEFHLERDGPRPVCSRCDMLQMFDFDGVCDGCLEAMTTIGLYCVACDQIKRECYTKLAFAKPGSLDGPRNPPIERARRRNDFDLNKPPVGGESSDETDED